MRRSRSRSSSRSRVADRAVQVFGGMGVPRHFDFVGGQHRDHGLQQHSRLRTGFVAVTALLAIDANSAEEIRVGERPGGEALDLLSSLERREVNSLPFELVGRVRTQEDGYLRFEQKGHLYPVPGRPGSFRSAATQAKELRRDEKL